MAVHYKVWVHVEEFDEATDEGMDMYLPFGCVREFRSMQDAIDFATALHNHPPLVWRSSRKRAKQKKG